ncbi:MAG: sugar phosphate nucleotidyltransferase [Solirubrobacteraceae bacterium]
MAATRAEEVLILCGGRGTRLQEGASSIPKPLVEIGGRAIVWHVINIYVAHGFRRFLLLTGHLAELMDEFVAGESWPAGVSVETVFTGTETPTGGRIRLAANRLSGSTFCATYADGVADIDLGSELDHHRAHGGLATMSVVRPQLQFGVTELGEDGRVAGFQEKPRSDQRWLLPVRAGLARVSRRIERARARAPRGPRRRRSAACLPPHGLLALHGHLQGRGHAQRPVGVRGAVAGVGVSRGKNPRTPRHRATR